jgi:hypothetical protein
VSQSLKLIFDECCSKRLARKIVEIYEECYPGLQTKHLSDLCKPGTNDEDWIPMLEKDKEWIILTADRGKDAKKQKLQVICSRFGITHIAFTSAVMRDGYKAQKQALLCVWPQIMRVPLIARPKRVSLGYRMFNKGLTKSPWLSIDGQAFDIWCKNNGISN